MPFIGIPYFNSEGKLSAEICLCSDNEYKLYMSTRISPILISTTFLSDYLTKNNCHINDIQNSDLSLKKKEELTTLWSHTTSVTVENVYVFLSIFKLDYDLFIDEYCVYLKSLKFKIKDQ